jgi:hypothetical protein
VVTGDHDRTNACGSRSRDRVAGFSARRIDDANQPGEHEILFDTFVEPCRMLRKGVRCEPAASNRQRPERLAREGVVRLEYGGAPFRGERPSLLAYEFSRAARQQDIRGAFGEHDAAVSVFGVPVQCAHQLAFR